MVGFQYLRQTVLNGFILFVKKLFLLVVRKLSPTFQNLAVEFLVQLGLFVQRTYESLQIVVVHLLSIILVGFETVFHRGNAVVDTPFLGFLLFFGKLVLIGHCLFSSLDRGVRLLLLIVFIPAELFEPFHGFPVLMLHKMIVQFIVIIFLGNSA